MEKGHDIVYPIAGKVLQILGFPDRSSAVGSKKTE